jgi:hypothetical protein
MTRQEIEPYVGLRVSAWTSVNGTYVGTLVRLVDCKPWRGIVLVDAVLECWCLYEIGRFRQRHGLELGQEYDFGNSSIKPCDSAGMSKREALEREIESATQWLNSPEMRSYHPDVPLHIREEAWRQLKEMYHSEGVRI